MRFKRSKADSCVYFKREDKNRAIIAIYVDDLLILTNNEKTKVLLKGKLSQKFDMKDLGEARYLLGMNITRDRKSGKIWLNQTTYIQRILQKFGMSECKSVSTPFNPSNKLSDKMEPRSSEKSHEMNKIPYREAIGSLLYAGQGTRPDITHRKLPKPLHAEPWKRTLVSCKACLQIPQRHNRRKIGVQSKTHRRTWRMRWLLRRRLGE